jgi:hypothetical protein
MPPVFHIRHGCFPANRPVAGRKKVSHTTNYRHFHEKVLIIKAKRRFRTLIGAEDFMKNTVAFLFGDTQRTVRCVTFGVACRVALCAALCAGILFGACENPLTDEAPPPEDNTVGAKSADNSIRAFYYEDLCIIGRIDDETSTIKVLLPEGTPAPAIASPVVIFNGTGCTLETEWVFDEESGNYTAVYSSVAENGAARSYTVIVSLSKTVTSAAPDDENGADGEKDKNSDDGGNADDGDTDGNSDGSSDGNSDGDADNNSDGNADNKSDNNDAGNSGNKDTDGTAAPPPALAGGTVNINTTSGFYITGVRFKNTNGFVNAKFTVDAEGDGTSGSWTAPENLTGKSVTAEALLFRDDLDSGTYPLELNEGKSFVLGTEKVKLSSAAIPVATADDLLKIAGNTEYLGFAYMLVCDIDLSGVEWKPIGESSSFSGVFSGGGHCIKNFTLNSGGKFSGFFGNVRGKAGSAAVIKNLKIELAESGVINLSASNDHLAGILAGWVQGNVLIQNIAVTGSALDLSELRHNSSGTFCAGGIVGRMEDKGTGKSYIRECSVTLAVNAITNEISSQVYAGGICGYAGSNTEISNCYAHGTVSAEMTRDGPFKIAYNAYAGGIAGYALGGIANCWAAGTIAAKNEAKLQSGGSPSYAAACGIAGALEGASASITNCAVFGSACTAESASGAPEADNSRAFGIAWPCDDFPKLSGNIIKVSREDAGLWNACTANERNHGTPTEEITTGALSGKKWDFTTIWSWENGDYPQLRAGM